MHQTGEAEHRMDMLTEIESGTLRGRTGIGPAGVRHYLGIPYAAPPLGALRWRAPQPVLPWAGTRDATRFGDDAPQESARALRGAGMSEDCLTLNVWAPEGARALPVLVWLHGGGFTNGSGSDPRSDGAALATRGAVVVTVNYRLGLLGYLAHPGLSATSDEGISGNYGLLDQIAALGWVRRNIAAFGGDPARVTLAGVSAGGSAAALLLTVPAADALFSRVVMHSPGTWRRLATLAEAEQAGAALGDLERLRVLDADALLALAPRLDAGPRGLTTPRKLRPIQDGVILPLDERAAHLGGQARAMPMIIGNTACEGRFFMPSLPQRSPDDFAAYLRAGFPACFDDISAAYPVTDEDSVRAQLSSLFGDALFNVGVGAIARCNAAREARTWRHLFAFNPAGQSGIPTHTQDIPVLFGNLPPRMTEGARALSAAMGEAWVRSAATGDPNGGTLPAWPACDADGAYLALDDPPRPGTAWRQAELARLETWMAREG